MGDPVEIHLRGYSLTLRLDDAAKITLRQEEEN
jgi:Fe2+ transport system protein FeoA